MPSSVSTSADPFVSPSICRILTPWREAALHAFTFNAPTFNVVTYICNVRIEDHLAQPRFEDDAQKLHMHILVVARQLDLLLRRILIVFLLLLNLI